MVSNLHDWTALITHLLVRLLALQRLDSSHLPHGLLNLALLTERLDLLRTTLDSQLDFGNFPHLPQVSGP